MKVYHGTNKRFKEFDSKYFGSNTGELDSIDGVWFTTSKEVAIYYAFHRILNLAIRLKRATPKESEKLCSELNDLGVDVQPDTVDTRSKYYEFMDKLEAKYKANDFTYYIIECEVDISIANTIECNGERWDRIQDNIVDSIESEDAVIFKNIKDPELSDTVFVRDLTSITYL